MVDEFVNNPQDLEEERFMWLEAQVVDINYNMSVLMVVLSNKLAPLREDEILTKRLDKRVDWGI